MASTADRIFPSNLDLLYVKGDTGESIAAGRAISFVSLPADRTDRYGLSTVRTCAAGEWPWGVVAPYVAAPITPTQSGEATPFSEAQLIVDVDAALTAGTYLRVTSSGKFGDANGSVACCQLLETLVAPGLAWITTIVGRLRNVGTATISTSGPTLSSASYTLIPEMTATVSVRTGSAFVLGFCAFDLQSNDAFDLALYVDGSIYGIARPLDFFGGSLLGLTPARFRALSVPINFPVFGLLPGSHTFELRASVSAGTMRAVGTGRSFQVIEF